MISVPCPVCGKILGRRGGPPRSPWEVMWQGWALTLHPCLFWCPRALRQQIGFCWAVRVTLWSLFALLRQARILP